MSWHTKVEGQYNKGSTECTDNAKEIYNYLSARGWSLNAISGLLGNIWHESGLNPWRWQNDSVGTSGGSPWSGIGYGLVQFTPAGNYINNSAVQGNTNYGPNFSDKTGKNTDGIAQLYFVDSNQLGAYIPTAEYPQTYSQYKSSMLSAYELAAIWLVNYERAYDTGASARRERGTTANYFYNLLSGETPPEPPTGEYTITIQIEGNGSAYADLGDDVPIYSAGAGVRIGLAYHPNGNDTFLGFEVVSGGITITDYHFTMPSENVIILARFTGTTPKPTPKAKRKSKIIYMIPWWRKYGL